MWNVCYLILAIASVDPFDFQPREVICEEFRSGKLFRPKKLLDSVLLFRGLSIEKSFHRKNASADISSRTESIEKQCFIHVFKPVSTVEQIKKNNA